MQLISRTYTQLMGLCPTPGPWRVPYLDRLPNGTRVVRIDSAQRVGVAVVAMLPVGAEVNIDAEVLAIQQANADLIALAPELREAVRLVVETWLDIEDKRSHAEGKLGRALPPSNADYHRLAETIQRVARDLGTLTQGKEED
jgi:hypothetical protein